MRYSALIVGVVLLASAPVPASAQIKLDMNRITCGEWLGYGPSDRDFVTFFMSGYYNAAENSDVLDYDRLERNSAKVMAFCERHKSDTLPTAIKDSAR
jgi:hypothetical protein